MTVKDFIKLLKTYPQDYEVCCHDRLVGPVIANVYTLTEDKQVVVIGDN